MWRGCGAARFRIPQLRWVVSTLFSDHHEAFTIWSRTSGLIVLASPAGGHGEMKQAMDLE